MEPIGTIRFRFELIINWSDRDSIKKYMDNVIRGAEALHDDTEIRYQFSNWDISNWDMEYKHLNALSIQWTVEDVPILDQDERGRLRGTVVHNLRYLIDKYALVLSEECVL